LSWFEFNLLILKYEHQEEEKKLLEEMEWLRVRKIWVLMVNYMRDSKVKPTAFKESDLIKLSFDNDEAEIEKEKLLTPEEVEKLFPKTLNNKK
jgi:hypothetical protein